MDKSRSDSCYPRQFINAQVKNAKNGNSCKSIIKVEAAFDGIIVKLPEIVAQKDSSFVVDMTVQNFTNISQFIISLSWDKSIITFNSLGFNYDDFNFGNFLYFTNQNNNSLTAIFYDDPANGGISFNNIYSLFRLYFKAIGQKGLSTSINFLDVNTNTSNRFLSSDGSNLPVLFLPGKVTILENPCENAFTAILDAEGKAEFFASTFSPNAKPDDIVYVNGSEKLFLDCNDLGLNWLLLTNVHFDGTIDSCELMINVKDFIRPILSLKDSVSIELDDNNNFNLSPDLFILNSSDNCKITSYSISPTSIDCNSVNPTPVVITAIDQSGNKTSANSFVNIISTNNGGPMRCDSSVFISVTPVNSIEITPELLLENKIYCGSSYVVEIYDDLLSSIPQDDNILDIYDVGQINYGKTTNTKTGEYCWTEIHISSLFDIPVQFIFPNKYANKGDNVKTELRVKGFQNIRSLQLGLQWDDQVIRFDSLKFPQGADFPAAENLLYESFGNHVKIYYDNRTQNQHLSIPRDGVLFEIFFTTIGSENESSELKLFEEPDFKIEIINSDNKFIQFGEKSGSIIISGNLGNVCAHTFKGFPIPDVKMIEGIYTDKNGCADLKTVAVGTELRPGKVGDWAEAIDIMDVIILQHFLLGLHNIHYAQYLAADLNFDQKISAADIIILKKIALGKDSLDGYPNWMFFDAECKFFNENYAYFSQDSCDQSVIYQGLEFIPSFLGIKKGYLNGSYNDDNYLDWSFKKDFSISDMAIIQGQKYRFDIVSEENLDMEGIQFTLDFDPDIIGDITISSDSLNYYSMEYSANISEDSIKVFYVFPVIVKKIHAGTPLFTITFESKSNSTLHDGFSLSENSVNIVKLDDSETPYIVNFLWENEINKNDDFFIDTIDIILSPQPTKDIVNFEIKGLENYKDVTYSLIDILGNKLDIDMLNRNTIDVANLPEGIYLFLLSKNNNVIQSKKMMIAR